MRSGKTRITDDAGAAVVEFVFVAVLLMVPVVYLIVALAHIQGATFAAQAAARDGSRAAVVGGVDALREGGTSPEAERAARRHAGAVMAVTLADFRVGDSAFEVSCTSSPCLEPGGDVVVDVTVTVELPVIGSLLPSAAVTVSSSSSSPVDGYAG